MTELKTVTMVPLNGSNYPTWNVQCRMALQYCLTEEMIADMLTKGLPYEQLAKLQCLAGIGPMPS